MAFNPMRPHHDGGHRVPHEADPSVLHPRDDRISHGGAETSDDEGECCPEGSRFMVMSAVDEISRSIPVHSIGPADYQNAADAETFFGQIRSSGEFEEEQITFEIDNGWFDVDGSDPSARFQPLSSLNSPYAWMSPAGTGADGRTTGIPSSFSGVHNPNATAEGTVRFMAAGGDFKVDFSLSQIGHYGGPDEPGLARETSSGNIDRGINVTSGVDAVSGTAYDQFLEVIPSESAEGSLDVRFSGTDFSGGSWENPVYGFGFYLMGREDKRNVILDVYDVNDNLITSETTHGSGVSASDAAVEYIAFHVCEDEEDVGRFVLREEFDGSRDHGADRDIFSIDNLTLFTRADASDRPFEEIIGPAVIRDELTHHHISGRRSSWTGTSGPDSFNIDPQRGFGKKQADRILDFRGDDGDLIQLSSELFDGRTDLEIARVSNRRDMKAMSRSDVDLVIWDHQHKPMSMLMVNGNGDEKGFGNGGGLAAMLERPSGFEADSVMVV